MFFWKYKELARALKANTVTDRQYNIYAVLFWLQAIYMTVSVATAKINYTPLNVANIVVLPLLFIVLWLGVTYAINKAGDNKDYAKRLICLDLPATIRTFAIMLVPTLGAQMVQVSMMRSDGLSREAVNEALSRGTIIDSILLIIMSGYSLILSAIGFKIASGQRD